jgi:uncharacterized membrane protein (UPF0127 family)
MTDAVETFRRNVSTRRAGVGTAALICALVLCAFAACGGTALAPTPVTTGSDGAALTRLTFVNKDNDEVDLLVEVADSPEERSAGLMSRESLPEDQGMLFVYEQDGQYTFYMRNTFIPLSIAFVKSDGAIVEIEDMEPQTDDLHSGPEPYRYTVEANQGWYERNGIAAGSQVRIALTTPAATAGPTTTP